MAAGAFNARASGGLARGGFVEVTKPYLFRKQQEETEETEVWNGARLRPLRDLDTTIR